MTKNYTYVPSDLEQLLLTKEYDELTATELKIANEHASNSKEYSQMKLALTTIVTNVGSQEIITPQLGTKNALMDQFAKVHSSKTGAWFSFSNLTFRYALIGLTCLAIIAITLWPSSNPTSKVATAQNNSLEEKTESIILMDSINTTIVLNDSESQGANIDEISATNSIDIDTTEYVSIGNNRTTDSETTDEYDDQLHLNVRHTSSRSNYDPTTANGISNHVLNQGDTLALQFNGIHNNDHLMSNMAQTRDYNNNINGNAFGLPFQPVLEPQSMAQNSELLNLLHTATEK